jgi:hypothetical protein
MPKARIAGVAVTIVSLGIFASGVLVAATIFSSAAAVTTCYWHISQDLAGILLLFGLPGGGAGIIGGTALMLYGRPGRSKGFRRTMLIVTAGVILIIVLSYGAVVSTFGVYSTFTSSPNVRVSSASCTGSQPVECSMILTNTGGASAQTTGSAQIFAGGHSVTGTCNNETLNPDTTDTIECSFQSVGLSQGAAYSGAIPLTGGGLASCGWGEQYGMEVPFTAIDT